MDAWKPLKDVPELLSALTGQDQEPIWYYVGSDATQEGPVSEAVLKQMFTSEQIDVNTFGWKEGMEDWVALSSLPELKSVFGSFSTAASKEEDFSKEEGAVW
eukprot:TRINITY_DN96224_c0_g1_i1.p1 TRINITY_DN96224_c0_g1~~TRINITY_DN96224_c0_g1_i1.p1  ORF type:complete len:102 (-),score=7.55 TRINITY_DN96224_c0_g1_i1:6-311(-)